MPRCENQELAFISIFKYTHNNKDENGNDDSAISVGSSVNLFCEDNSTRITKDVWDDNPYDFNMTVLCKPDNLFDTLEDNFPECKAWCPSEKPIAPPVSGLILKSSDNNSRYRINLSFID